MSKGNNTIVYGYGSDRMRKKLVNNKTITYEYIRNELIQEKRNDCISTIHMMIITILQR